MQTPAQLLEGASLPPDVRDLAAPPARLFLHGNAPRGPRVAIVGTRFPSAAARAYGEELAYRLAAHGIAILSGGAKGIDAGAHEGALRAGGVTLVVAASSFDRPYPAEHRALFEDIVAHGGGYLSRFAAGVEARRHQFLDRNALLAALCHALVVVEAPLRSGARNAANWARQLGRPCFVVPSPPWNERGRGCIAELQLGARPLGSCDELLRWFDEHVSELPAASSDPGLLPDTGGRRPIEVSSMPPGGRANASSGAASSAPLGERVRSRRPAAASEDATCAAVLAALEAGARYAEELSDAMPEAGLSELNHAIMTLLLSGAIARAADGELTVTRR